jgi:hypothetical protein
MFSKLERTGEAVAVAYMKVLFWHLPRGSNGNNGKHQKLCHSQHLNWVRPK